MKRIISIIMIVMLFITVLPINTVLANEGGNVGGTDAGGNTGSGNGNWQYTKRGVGVRLSIYWAESEEAFAEWDKVIKVGDTVNLIPDGIPSDFKPEYYSNKTVFDYMNGKETKFNTTKVDKNNPFTVYTKTESIVSKMPDPISGDSDSWLEYFLGIPYKEGKPVDSKSEPTFGNIPAITKLCGCEISADDFADGTLDYHGNVYSNGWYKIFIEPELACYINGTSCYMTLRDMIKLGESGNANTSTSKLVSNLNLMFEYLANPLYLIEQETAALNMTANSYNGQPYKVHYDEATKTSDKAEIIKQLGKNGKIRESMGCGVINPQRIKSNGNIKVVKSYVQYVPEADGSYTYKTYAPSTEEYMSKDGVESLIEMAQVPVPLKGDEDAVGFINDIITAKDIAPNVDTSQITWETGLAKNQVTGDEITAKLIKSFNIGIRSRLTYFLKNNIPVKEAKLATATENYADYTTTYSVTYRNNMGKFEKLDESQITTKFYDVVPLLDLEISNESFKALQTNDAIAKGFYKSEGVRGDLDYMIDNANYITEAEDVALGNSKPNTVYIRYIVMAIPQQITLIEKYVDGEYAKTDEVAPNTNALSVQVIEDTGTISNFITNVRNIDGIPDDAEFQGWGIAEGYQTTKPTKFSESGKTSTVNQFLNSNENLYVIYREDKSTAKSVDLTVPQWRLSKNDDKTAVGQEATATLSLKDSHGCYAGYEYLSPSGIYDARLFNPNGKETESNNTPANMFYTDWLHSKAISTGSNNISLSNPEGRVQITGKINAIKATPISGIKLASWVFPNKLSDYSLSVGTSSKVSAKTVIKKANLEYSIKNKDSYSHTYGVYNHYYVPADDAGTPKDPKDDTPGYWACGCYTQSETPSTSYLPAKYNLGLTYELYKATDNSRDALKVKATKTEENGKTTIVKQNNEYLTIYPEIPMLFQDDTGKESVVFAAGSVGRKISLVDYHTLEYTAYVESTASGTPLVDSKAKAKAREIGLGSLPVFAKGSPLSLSFKVNASKGSNAKGSLTVKSYALDIDNDSLKSTWGNEDYSSKAAHTSIIDSFNNFSNGTATEQLDIAVPGGTNSAYIGPKATNNLSYKLKDTDAIKHTLTVRGGVLIEVDGKSIASIKANDKELYAALEGMKLVGNKDETVLKTLVSSVGSTLTEATFATLANKERGVSDIKTGDGWYFEDTTALVLVEYVSTFELPISMFSDKIPLTVKGLETPKDKSQFFSVMSKGYNVLNYTMTSSNISGLGTVKVYFEHNSRTGSDYGSKEPTYATSNAGVSDTTFGGGF